jgi:O-acetyl-ADP-ribose deacetylase (regulator of RNase III)
MAANDGPQISDRSTEGLEIDVPERITVTKGDITRLELDAVVNAANSSLLGGGGVDGAIHRAAGPGLLEECRRMGGCPTGRARITGGYDLPARFVIHVVGPAYRDGTSGEAALLRSCYVESLTLAAEAGVLSIAFPCISTGVYGYPKPEACEIAASTVENWLSDHAQPESVVFCCFDDESTELYRQRLGIVE